MVAKYNQNELHDKKYISENQWLTYNEWEINKGPNETVNDAHPNLRSDLQYVQKLLDMEKADVDKMRIVPQHPDGMSEKPTLPTGSPSDSFEGTDKTPMPAAPSTDGSSGNSIRIDTETLEKFANNVMLLDNVLDLALAELAKVNIAPGIFGAGTNLYGVYVGKGEAQGLHGNLLAFIKSLKETFYDIKADMDNMVLDYKTTEDIAEMTSDQLEAAFKETFGDIKGLSKHVK
jgi:hypothetical protein